jgi:hypothetical protein
MIIHSNLNGSRSDIVIDEIKALHGVTIDTQGFCVTVKNNGKIIYQAFKTENEKLQLSFSF